MKEDDFDEILVAIGLDKPLIGMIQEHLEETDRELKDFIQSAAVSHMQSWKKIKEDECPVCQAELP